jgi:hypothetical protein
VLTAVMRRPWSAVRREVAAALRAGPPGRQGVASALPDLRAALQRRRPVSPTLAAQVELLEAAARAPAG